MSLSNRPGRHGGGVDIVTRDNITNMTSPANGIESYEPEIEWIEVKRRHKKIYIGC